jgi:CBS domain-containing protein
LPILGYKRPANTTVCGTGGTRRKHDIAAHELVTVGPDQDVEEARQLMAQHELDRILVVEEDRLVGIISEADIRADEGPLG